MVNYKKFYILFFLISITSLLFANHKFYSSITQIEYNQKTKTFEIIIRVFADDLEKAIQESGSKEYRISKDVNQDLMKKYVNSHFVFKTYNKALPNKFIGTEQDKDIQILYLEIPANQKSKSFTIKNSMLIDLFNSQVNIMNLNFRGEKQTFIFNAEQIEKNLTFN